jgi:voltage-gated potassium channel Kch
MLSVALGIAMMSACLALQIFAAIMATQRSRHFRTAHADAGTMRAFWALATVMAFLTFGILAQIAAWALLYRLLDGFATLEEALYFSGVTYTSLGYGDVVMKGEARFLAPMEAMTGLMMFAIVTATLMRAMARLGKGDRNT